MQPEGEPISETTQDHEAPISPVASHCGLQSAEEFVDTSSTFDMERWARRQEYLRRERREARGEMVLKFERAINRPRVCDADAPMQVTMDLRPRTIDDDLLLAVLMGDDSPQLAERGDAELERDDATHRQMWGHPPRLSVTTDLPGIQNSHPEPTYADFKAAQRARVAALRTRRQEAFHAA